MNWRSNTETNVPHGDKTLQVPVRKNGKAHLYTLAAEQVRLCSEDTLYCLHDHAGPALYIRASRLAQLRRRLQPEPRR